jgi:hypothetical protein
MLLLDLIPGWRLGPDVPLHMQREGFIAGLDAPRFVQVLPDGFHGIARIERSLHIDFHGQERNDVLVLARPLCLALAHPVGKFFGVALCHPDRSIGRLASILRYAASKKTAKSRNYVASIPLRQRDYGRFFSVSLYPLYILRQFCAEVRINQMLWCTLSLV